MGLIKKNKEVVALAGIVLKSTRHITEADVKADHAWATVAKEYAETEKSPWIEKAQVSLINAILFHRKGAFILTRDNFADICREDKNWIKKIGLKDSNWQKFLYESSGIIQAVKQVKNPKSSRMVYIYKVVMPEILSLLSVNIEEQIISATDFIKSPGFSVALDQGNLSGNVEIDKDLNLNLNLDLESEEVCPLYEGATSTAPFNSKDKEPKEDIFSIGQLDLISLVTDIDYLIANGDQSKSLSGIRDYIFKFGKVSEKQTKTIEYRMGKMWLLKTKGLTDPQEFSDILVTEEILAEIDALYGDSTWTVFLKDDFKIKFVPIAVTSKLPLDKIVRLCGRKQRSYPNVINYAQQ